MNREIKFRSKIEGDAGLYEVRIIDQWEDRVFVDRACGHEWVALSRIKLMQFTGLLDRYNCPIYEDDIIQINDQIKYRVYWNVRSGAWHKVSNDGDDYGPYGGPLMIDTDYDKARKLVVIGNIHEHPKLLKS